DIFLAKYDTDGNQIWIEQFGSEDDEGTYLLNITIDNKDNIYLTGNTNGNLGGKNSGSFDAWVSKFSSNGRQRWTRQFGTSKLDYATSVTFDGKRSLVVTGFTEGSIRRQENKGAIDSWVASLNVRNGALRNKFKPIKSRVNPRSSGATATDSLTSLATEIDASDRPLEVSSSGGNPLPSDATSVISNSLEGFGKKIVDPLETLVTERFRGSSFPSMNNLLIDNNELNPQEISNDFSSLSATTLDIDLI
ncbi:MAG: SBBP repeat-containing protein, partial [Cyanobacteria bacterium P01_E01_bin.6]